MSGVSPKFQRPASVAEHGRTGHVLPTRSGSQVQEREGAGLQGRRGGTISKAASSGGCSDTGGFPIGGPQPE